MTVSGILKSSSEWGCQESWGWINCWLSWKSCKTNDIPTRHGCAGFLVLISMQGKTFIFAYELDLRHLFFLKMLLFFSIFYHSFAHCASPVLHPHWWPQRVHCPLSCPPLPFLSNQIATRKCQHITASIHIWWRMNSVYSVWNSGLGRDGTVQGETERRSHRRLTVTSSLDMTKVYV